MEPRSPSVGDVEAARESVLSDYQPKPTRDRYGLHLLLFFLTLACTTVSGGFWADRMLVYGAEDLTGLLLSPAFLLDGFRFAFSLLLFLTVHEFGHYVAARRHGVDTSLPYYIPLPPPLGIGTLGAVIRIREPIPSLKKLFDIGAAGPLAGFVVALGVLLYALATLPPPTYLLDLGGAGHEAIKQYIEQHGRFPDQMPADPDAVAYVVGQTPLYWLLAQLFPNVPPMYEMYHYPVLFAGWLGLFFTALNLLPIGQLDGGHILYALVGPVWHGRLARGFVLLLLLSGAVGFAEDVMPWMREAYPLVGRFSWFILAGLLYIYLVRVFKGDQRATALALLGLVGLTALAGWIGPAATQYGYVGWFVFGALIVFLIRVDHPPVLYREPLTPTRRVLAVLSLLVFVACFSIRPFYLV